jgi:tetratricopeptide (TPR) repeat protein/uncharacterized caspase-like protein
MPRFFSDKYMPQYKKSYYLIVVALIASLYIAGAGFAQNDANASKTFAVIIGISKYPKLPENQQLLFADKDAQTFASSIKRTTGENQRLLLNQEATAAAIKESIGNWLAASTNENDTVYIYFSGHGIVETEYGEAYLMAYDSDAKLPYASGVSLRELSYAVSRRVKAGRILIIADAVRRDFFDAELVGDAPSKIFTTSFNQLSQWRGGIATLLANSAGEYSREGQKWGSLGVFTKFLVEAISNNTSANGEEIFSYISARIAKETGKKQHPSKSGTNLAQISLTNNSFGTVTTTADSRKETQTATPTQTPAPVQIPAVAAANTAKPAEPIAKATTATTPKQEPSPKSAETVIVEGAKPAPQISQTAKTETPKSAQPVAVAKKPDAVKTPVATNQSESVKPPTTIATSSTKKPALAPKPSQTASANDEAKIANATPVKDSPSTTIATAATPPVKSSPTPPPVVAVPPTTVSANTEKNVAPMPVNNSAPAPSPLVLEFESALNVGRLIEPKGNCAWDTYQQLSQNPATSADAARFKSRLAEALFASGKEMVSGDVRSDNISEKADDFRRAGQMLAKAKLLTPERAEIAALEKLSAAQALLALQFFDEAEKALTQLPKTAATENALGIVYAGKLDTWKAERAFKNATELEPTAAAPHYNLGSLYRSQKNEAALAEFEKAAELSGKNYAAFLALGDEYFGQNKWQQAAEAYRKAVALRPYDDNLHTKLGHALYSQGLRDEANKEYQKAKEIRSKQ